MVFPIDRPRNWMGLVIPIALAIVCRLVAALAIPDSMIQTAGDPDDYARFAHTLATVGTYGPNPDQPSAYRSPGYPLLLVGWCLSLPPMVWGILSVHLVLSAGIVVLTWLLAKKAGIHRWAWLAAFLVAINPLLIRQATVIMTETLFTFLFAACLVLWIREASDNESSQPVKRRPLPYRFSYLRELIIRLPQKQPIELSDYDAEAAAYLRRQRRKLNRGWWTLLLLGIGVGYAALTRSIMLPVWIALWIPSVIFSRQREWLVVSIIAVCCLLPWAVRNQQRFGSPILTTTHGGYTLWLGQNPVFYEQVVAGHHEVWTGESFEEWTRQNMEWTGGMSETDRDRFFRDQAIEWMQKNPRAFGETVLHHIASFWSPMPKSGPVHLRRACLIYYLTVFLLAAVAIIHKRLWTTDLLALPFAMLIFTLVHSVYWSDMRMRAPLEPVLAVLVAMTVQMLFSYRQSRADRARRPWQ